MEAIAPPYCGQKLSASGPYSRDTSHHTTRSPPQPPGDRNVRRPPRHPLPQPPLPLARSAGLAGRTGRTLPPAAHRSGKGAAAHAGIPCDQPDGQDSNHCSWHQRGHRTGRHLSVPGRAVSGSRSVAGAGRYRPWRLPALACVLRLCLRTGDHRSCAQAQRPAALALALCRHRAAGGGCAAGQGRLPAGRALQCGRCAVGRRLGVDGGVWPDRSARPDPRLYRPDGRAPADGASASG